MGYELVTVQIGHPRYEELVGRIRADEWLRSRMWADAEHRLDEQPGKLWTITTVGDGGRWVPAAWAAAVVEDGVLRCCDNYEHPHWRGCGLYAAAYAHRHTVIVQPSPLPAVTYLFAQPIPLHEADGWYRTGMTGLGELPGHRWWQLRRDPTG